MIALAAWARACSDVYPKLTLRAGSFFAHRASPSPPRCPWLSVPSAGMATATSGCVVLVSLAAMTTAPLVAAVRPVVPSPQPAFVLPAWPGGVVATLAGAVVLLGAGVPPPLSPDGAGSATSMPQNDPQPLCM